MKSVQVFLLALAIAAVSGSIALGSTQVLIGLRERTVAPEAARLAVTQELNAVAGRIEHEYRSINAVLAEVPREALPALLHHPYVKYIERDGQVTAPTPLEEEGLRLSFEWLPWGVDRIDAEVVHHPPQGLLAFHHSSFDEQPPLPGGNGIKLAVERDAMWIHQGSHRAGNIPLPLAGGVRGGGRITHSSPSPSLSHQGRGEALAALPQWSAHPTLSCSKLLLKLMTLPEGERNELASPHQGERCSPEILYGQTAHGRTLILLLVFALLGMACRGGHGRRPLLASLTLIGLALWLTGCDLIYIRVRPSTQGPKGAGVRVAVLDTGIDPEHSDLGGGFWGGHDFVNDDPDPWDDNGHGTEVAGILGARENGFGLIGVAPRSALFAVKVLGSDAKGSISDVIKGLEWAIDNGMDVVNMSLGTPEDSQALREAVQAAWEAGLVLVSAAGNESRRVLYPAAYREVIAVSAADRRDRLAWFSNFGAGIELTAPGEEVPATYPGNSYGLSSGTSFAAAHVAGVAALLISSGIRDNQEARTRLQETAESLGLGPEEEGFGLVDAEHAVLRTVTGDN